MTKLFRGITDTYYRALGYYPISINGLKFKTDPYHVDFWQLVKKGKWESNTYKVLAEFLNKNSTYCDIGAWIGPTAIYAAKLCRQVICFEPDPVAFRYLQWNIELNALDNITSYNIALSDKYSIQKMSSFAGSIGDSTTSLLCTDNKSKKVDVIVLTWKSFIELSNIDSIDFMKIDIEGGEFLFLPSISDYLLVNKPVILLSIHTPYLSDNTRKEELERLRDIIGMYRKCLNMRLKPVDMSEFFKEENMNKFRSLILTD